MDTLEALVELIRSPDATLPERHQAFGEVVARFQDMAYGCAYAILGDAQMAQDAAQEAFISAYQNLDQLAEPRAFPGWFRRIVLTSCNRLTRDKRPATEPLLAEATPDSHQPEPAAALEKQELWAQIEAAIQALPEHQRLATVLYYIDGYSQKQVAEFLEVSLPLTKKWLQRGRERLRERMMDMVRDNLRQQRPSRDERFLQTVMAQMALDAVALESQLSLLEMLLVDGLDVNARGKDGQTLLHWAAQRGHVEAIEMLLQYGADPAGTDRLGKTPLQWAVENKHPEAARVLRRAGGT